MAYIIYILVYPILWLTSKLPFWLLYKVSDFFCFIIYYLVGYRKKVVTDNLKLVFPEKSEKEIIRIRGKFYQHMCDMFLEMVKTLSISEKSLRQRFHITNPDYIQDIEKRKSVIVMFSHYASWEWSIIIQKDIKSKGFGVYKRIHNPYFDKLVRDIRAKYNTQLITTKETIPVVLQNQRKGITGVYGFISDQSPKMGRFFHWKHFLNIHVPVFTGAEMLARKVDLAVCFLKVEKVKRGHYQGTFIPITENAKELPENEITDRFMDEVEKQIIEAPEYYLWTHKRWKHRDKSPLLNNNA